MIWLSNYLSSLIPYQYFKKTSFWYINVTATSNHWTIASASVARRWLCRSSCSKQWSLACVRCSCQTTRIQTGKKCIPKFLTVEAEAGKKLRRTLVWNDKKTMKKPRVSEDVIWDRFMKMIWGVSMNSHKLRKVVVTIKSMRYNNSVITVHRTNYKRNH